MPDRRFGTCPAKRNRLCRADPGPDRLRFQLPWLCPEPVEKLSEQRKYGLKAECAARLAREPVPGQLLLSCRPGGDFVRLDARAAAFLPAENQRQRPGLSPGALPFLRLPPNRRNLLLGRLRAGSRQNSMPQNRPHFLKSFRERAAQHERQMLRNRSHFRNWTEQVSARRAARGPLPLWFATEHDEIAQLPLCTTALPLHARPLFPATAPTRTQP